MRELVEATGISHSDFNFAQTIGYEKAMTIRWIPRLLTVNHKRDRVTISKQRDVST